MKIGYIRVSIQEQNTMRQEVLMESLGVEFVRWKDTIDTTTPTGKFTLTFYRKVKQT